MLRYGRNNVGFLWVIIEPMILTGCVMAMWAQIKGNYEHGTHVLTLVLTGYMPLTLWRHTSGVGVHLFRKNQSVRYHRNITLLDVFFAKMLLEGAGASAALITVYGVLLATGLVDPIAKPGHMIAGWLLLWWLGAVVALILAVVTEASEVSERFVQPIQYMLVPLSGIFFMVDWMPRNVQALLSYNPITNCIELFRDGFFGDSVATYYYVGYVVLANVLLTYVALVMLDRHRDSFEMT